MSEVFHNLFPQGGPNMVAGQYFSGASYLYPLSDMGVSVSNVTFEPSCRNNWHIHHKGGQILLCTAGRGYYQEWGKPAQELNPGDVVNIPPEVKHWHGAAPDSWFAHVAISVPGSHAEWLEPVDEEVWSREHKLSPRDRSLITVSALMASGILDTSLLHHIERAKANGVTATEMSEALTQLAFYAGWPKAWAALRMAKDVYGEE